MEPVHILGRVDRVDHGVGVHVIRQWQLYQNAMHRGVIVQLVNQGQQIRFAGIIGQLMFEGFHPDLDGLFALGPDIDLTCRVFAHKDNRKTGNDPVLFFQPRYMLGYFASNVRRKRLAINHCRRHRHPLFLVAAGCADGTASGGSMPLGVVSRRSCMI